MITYRPPMSEQQPSHNARLVASDDALGALTSAIRAAPALALDTEFVRERTFFPELCLIQVATDSVVAAVDCLADAPLADFYAALGTSQRAWVLHSSSQDLEILVQAGIQLPAELIDTQIAAALLGMPPQIGYAQLVETLLGTPLNKTHTRTDWRRRPLPPGALEYAIDDVRYLLPLWERLDTLLSERDRLSWFTEDCAALLQRYGGDADELRWQRIKGIRGLDRTSQSVARELSAWREAHAAHINRPRQWVLSDETLVAMARGQPETSAALSRYDLTEKFRRRHGPQLVERVAQGRARSATREPLLSTSLSQAERKELKVLAQAVKERAAVLDLAPEILATRQELTQLMRGDTPARLATGWRAGQLAELTR